MTLPFDRNCNCSLHASVGDKTFTHAVKAKALLLSNEQQMEMTEISVQLLPQYKWSLNPEQEIGWNRPVEMWWYTRRNQISSFGETDESI